MIYTIGIDSMFSTFEKATIEQAVEYCSSKSILGVDTETTGLDFIDDKMIMFQIGDDIDQFVLDTRVISIIAFKDILESKTITKILHNAKFDYKFIKRQGIQWKKYGILC